MYKIHCFHSYKEKNSALLEGKTKQRLFVWGHKGFKMLFGELL